MLTSYIEVNMATSYTLDYHFLDDTKEAVEITYFVIPYGERRKGNGAAIYQQWEANLPPSVKLIRLFAADTGEGRSHDFWEQMGFDFEFEALEDGHIERLGIEAAYTMQKGLNGHVVDKITCDQWMEC